MSDEKTFVFCDLAGFTALTEAHGDHQAADVALEFIELARTALRPSTTLVKTIGDAVMLVAGSPDEGITTAIELHRAVEAQDDFPDVRAGVHAGNAVERDGDWFGSAVNITARIAAHARTGQILCTAAVAKAATDLDGIGVVPLGPIILRNVPDEMELFEVLDLSQVDRDIAVDPVCQMRIDPNTAPARLPYGGRTLVFCSFACASKFSADPENYLLSD